MSCSEHGLCSSLGSLTNMLKSGSSASTASDEVQWQAAQQGAQQGSQQGAQQGAQPEQRGHGRSECHIHVVVQACSADGSAVASMRHIVQVVHTWRVAHGGKTKRRYFISVRMVVEAGEGPLGSALVVMRPILALHNCLSGRGACLSPTTHCPMNP